jgi:hypothetical protein
MRIVIANLTTKEISTVHGPAKVLRFCDQPTGTWYDSFRGQWNEGWRDGMEIEVAPDQVKSRFKGDREYLTIMAPAKAPGARPPTEAPGGAMDPQVIGLLKAIVAELGQIKALLGARMEETPAGERRPSLANDIDPSIGF